MNTIRFPSGDHEAMSAFALSCFWPDPSRLTTYTSLGKPENRIVAPSGDHLGWKPLKSLPVMRAAPVPSAFMA